MNFLYPQFLWALLAISIPIIIHLFNFRKFKKVYFSELKLLKEVELQTSKKSTIKHLLILLMRILTITALVLAFAQPYFPSQTKLNSQGEKYVSVYIDNSFSMSNIVQEFSLLDQAKQQAELIAKGYKQSDKYQLITNNFESKHQRFLTQKEFLNMVQEIELTSFTRKLTQIEQKQLDFLNGEYTPNRIGYYISDFQKSTSDIENLRNDSSILTNFVHLSPEQTDNVFIDTVWFDSPIRVANKKEILNSMLVNNSSEDIQVKVELIINEKPEGFINQDIKANSTSEVQLNYQVTETGLVRAKLRISEYPNPVSTFDDDFYFSYLLEDSTQILVLNREGVYLDNTSGSINQLFKNDEFFKVKNLSAKSIDFSEFPQSKLIIINELNGFSSGLISELLTYMEAGGTVVFFPGTKVKLTSVNEFLLAINAGRFMNKDTSNTKVNSLNFEHPLFTDVFEKIPKNIDLPAVTSSYKFSISSRSRVEKLMKLQSGNEFLAKFNYKNGNAYIFTVPLDKSFSNLSSHSIFVTSLLRIAENSGVKQAVSELISTKSIELKDKNYELEALRILNEQLSIEVIPEVQRMRGKIKLFLPEEIAVAENYSVESKGNKIGGFGLNYDRLESDFDSYSAEELTSMVGNAVVIEALNSKHNSASSSLNLKDDFKWWKLFVLLALLFIAIEILIIKVMK